MTDALLQELLRVLSKRSWIERDQEFTLASGRRSRYYIDSKMTTLTPEGAKLVGEALYAALQATNAEAVGGQATAAVPMVTAVVMASANKSRQFPGFYVREEAKEHGTQKLIEGCFPQTPGAQVAIIDDVLTTGRSILKAIQAAEEAGARVAKVIVLVDRHEGGSERLRSEGYDLTALFETVEGGGLMIAEAPLAPVPS